MYVHNVCASSWNYRREKAKQKQKTKKLPIVIGFPVLFGSSSCSSKRSKNKLKAVTEVFPSTKL